MHQITKALVSVLPNGKEIKETTHYELQDPQTLARELLDALNIQSEDSFTTEAIVLSFDTDEPETSRQIDKEIFRVSFVPHSSWGLKGKVTHPQEGDFRFYLEFIRDAE